jgi:nitroreductase
MNEALWRLIAARRHVGLRRLLAPGPGDAALQDIVEAAGHAPDHGKLRPWRFILVPASRRADLGEVFVDALVARRPDADDAARTAARDKAGYAACLLVAVLVDDPAAGPVPRTEKLVALGAAIQNMLLAGAAAGYASGLASGGALDTPAMRRLLRLAAHEEAVSFIGFGTAAEPKPPRGRLDTAGFYSSL